MIQAVKKNIIIIILTAFCLFFPAFAADSAPSPKRIVSLAPSMTEIMFALGLGDKIVGVTTFCDYPEEAKKKPKIGGMSNPSLEAVLSLKPDIVVMTTDGNTKEFAERLQSLHIKTFISTAQRLNELSSGIKALGKVLGVKERSDRLAKEIDDGIATFSRRDSTSHSGAHRKVLFIVWPEPLVVAGAGTVIDDAISLIGEENIARSAKTEYPKFSVEEAIRLSPDVIVIGKGVGMDMQAVSKGILGRMASVPAVKRGKVCYLDDSLYRLGPRVVKGIEELAGCLR
jgi:iron complex transport system substrate-binding protein